jgi:hypothetical protein
MAILLLSGCTRSVVTVDGHSVTPVPVSSVDACSAVSTATVKALGLADEKPVVLNDPERPGCEWSGINDYITPDLILWVLAPNSASSSDESITISGVSVDVWVISDADGRYIVPCGSNDLTINYTQAKGPLAPKDALQLAAADIIAAYHCHH